MNSTAGTGNTLKRVQAANVPAEYVSTYFLYQTPISIGGGNDNNNE
jgi:hypothetical protein